MAKWSVPGGAVGFVRDGKLLCFRGYGYADRNTLEVVQPDSLFRLASLSKAFTAAAILRLAEQGQLSLDQPAVAMLNFAPPAYAGATNDARISSITIRHLLNHAGGWDRNTAITALKRAAELSKRFTPKLGTRSLDVLHVACALELKLGHFLTFDVRQQQLAMSAGMKIIRLSAP